MPGPLLADQTAVITGAAQGIGFAIAQLFIDEGAHVVIGDIDADAATAAAKITEPLEQGGARVVHRMGDTGYFDGEGRLAGIVTDGDIRRNIFRGDIERLAVEAARKYRIDDVSAAPEQTSDPGVA